MLRSSSRRTAILAIAIIAASLLGARAGISGQLPKEPIKFSVQASQPDRPLKPGDTFNLQLTARIEDGWHLYSTDQAEGGPTPTRIVIPDGQPFEQAGKLESPEPKTIMDPNFNLMTEYYEGEATFTIPVKVGPSAVPGKAEVKVNVSFQTCNDELCLPPKTVKLSAEINLAAR